MLKAKVQAPDDLNPQETSEWMDALDEIVDQGGPDRASYLLERLMEHASDLGVQPPLRWNTPYINTIPPEDEVAYPGNRSMERFIKWCGPTSTTPISAGIWPLTRRWRR
jgi:pyruvate dehydrogenase E1 component